MHELVEIFALVDSDHSGQISRDELKALMITLGIKAGNVELDLIMKEIYKATSSEVKSSAESSAVELSGEINFQGYIKTYSQLSYYALPRKFRLSNYYQFI